MAEASCLSRLGQQGSCLVLQRQVPSLHVNYLTGTFLVGQCLRLCFPSTGDVGSISGQGTRFHVPQLSVWVLQLCKKRSCMLPQRWMILCAATKTWHSQIHKERNIQKEIWLLQGGQGEDAMWRLSSQWAQLNSAFQPSPPRPWTADWSHFGPSGSSQLTTKSHCDTSEYTVWYQQKTHLTAWIVFP